MKSDPFVHLHVHTEYSLLDGASRIEDLTRQAAQWGMPALAITDHGNLFGAVAFYQAARQHGIKPIIGVEMYVAPSSRLDRNPQQGSPYHLVLLATNETGYKNLLKLVSLGYLEGFYYKPRIDKELLRAHAKGLIATSACLRGEVAHHLLNDRDEDACRAAASYQDIFGKDGFFLELMDHGLPEQKKVNEGLLKLAQRLKAPLVATNDVHYLNQDQAHAHEVLLCIQTQSTLNDPNRFRMKTDQLFFKPPAMMHRQFGHVPEALTNTLAIAERCCLELDFTQYHLPRFTPPDGLSQETYLNQLCLEGLQRRYGQHPPEEAKKRLAYELDIIKKMGFVSYFLIVWDFIRYARQRGIPVGPGRGSAAGSLVSYLLGITNLDPLRYGLLFERFLNPERAGMPDIDIDFCFERRGEVIEYVTKKYGQENVAQIITFGTMQARAVVRDVGRVLGVPYADVDRLAKLIPPGVGMTLEQALSLEPQLAECVRSDPTAAEIFKTARVLEGLTRHASIHAAGVVIADKPLTEYVPLCRTSDGQITTGFSMDGIAKMGLLKMDFLGLRTLTVIETTLNLIEQRRGPRPEADALPLDDPLTYQMLAKGDTGGVFQLESGGMRDLLRRSQPSCFEDLITILALYRPGPMGSGMLDDYIRRKKGTAPVTYPHPKLEAVLKDTYGIIVYQEQVMQIASVLAGFTMTQADHLRRAMSKKIPSVMEKMRHDFVAGCQTTSGIPAGEANRLFDLIEYFSGYGFNRSHSAAYALISYQTAYLKAHYPVEFMAALLTSEKDNTDKVVEYVREAEAHGMTVLPPDVNESGLAFTVIDDNTLRFGLLAVKNVGQAAIESILAARREGGRFRSLFDFCERVDLRLVNRKVLESLIKCGAFDSLGVFRSQLMAVVDQALELGLSVQRHRAAGQMSFFDLDTTSFSKEPALPDLQEWPPKQKLAYEKEILGFYVSGHPLADFQTEIERFATTTIRGLKRLKPGEEVSLVVLVSGVKLTTTKKKNERMAVLTLEDLNGRVDALVFPSSYAELAPYLKEGSVVLVQGRMDTRDNEPIVIVKDLRPLEQVYRRIRALHIHLGRCDQTAFKRLKEKLAMFPGTVPVFLRLDTKHHKGVEILVGEDFYVTPNALLLQEIKSLVGDKHIRVNF